MYWFHRQKKIKREDLKIKRFVEDYKALKPTRHSYADIKKITNQFKDKVGQGGYGTVYRGQLSNDVHVVVKILNNTKGNGEEFINEVGIIGTIHHVNVVHLVGYCADGFRRALTYEFLPNDSLEKFTISDCDKHLLGWKKLLEIAMGIAKGGKKNFDVMVNSPVQIYFPEWIYNRLDCGEELRISIQGEGDAKIAKKLAIVGLWCIQWYPVDRPSMHVVIQMLEGDGDTIIKPPNPFVSANPPRVTGQASRRTLNNELETLVELKVVRSRVVVNAAVHMVVVKAARSLLLAKRSLLVVRHARRSFGGFASCSFHVQGSVRTARSWVLVQPARDLVVVKHAGRLVLLKDARSLVVHNLVRSVVVRKTARSVVAVKPARSFVLLKVARRLCGGFS
ncbi:hypothetical protein RHSIM_Rhsim03G0202000 [Rhododendron simsii]|uniref:Serine-threonine/tyrosine-protein kinase catalytic domain-containing protein n=1 Tax=Rhododendron simsii TaxID=118357 RepID=A0A834H5W4_RHOSS|nr:hypothetical protein RHSIM_Rhsim03G0202000 [Rhododendron simsii]